MTALASTASHYFHSGNLDSNMVQEVGGYDTYAMLRQNSSYGNMHNLGGYNSAAAFGGGQQGMQYGGPEYAAAYHTSNPLQGGGGGGGGEGSWPAGMYPTSSVSPSASTARQHGSVLLEHEWPQTTQYVGNVTLQPHETAAAQMPHHLQHVVTGTGNVTPSATGSSSSSGGVSGGNVYTSYRGSGCLPTMPTDYATTSTSVVTSGMTSSMTPSPTPGSVIGGSPPGGGNVNRQTNRPPYDWMKKVSYPSTPSTVGGNGLGSGGRSINSKTRTKDKYRVVYTDHQRLELEKEFHYSRYITIRRKSELAQALSLSERQVKIWFQNRRAKERKQNKKRDEALGIKTERVDPLPLMSPLGGGSVGGHCDSGPQGVGHCGPQGQMGPLGGAGGMGLSPVGPGDQMSGMQPGTASLSSHTPPMSTHSPPMSGHHS